MRRTERGIFCIEGFADEAEALSFQTTLDFLSTPNVCDCSRLYRRADTRKDLIKALREWIDRGDWKYPILYLSFHGFDTGVRVDDPAGAGFDRVDLRTLSDVFEGELSGSLIHFSSCSTLGCPNEEIRRFFARTDATAISGYRKDVSWLESTALELLYLDLLQQQMTAYEETTSGVDPELVSICRERLDDSRRCHGLIDALGFRIFTSDDFDE